MQPSIQHAHWPDKETGGLRCHCFCFFRELDATRLAFESRLLMLEDSPEALMDIDLSWRLSGAVYDHDRYRERIASVTRDSVVEAARRLQLDTVYSLRPKGA